MTSRMGQKVRVPGGGSVIYTSVSPNDIGGIPAGLTITLADGQYVDFWWTVVSQGSDVNVTVVVDPDDDNIDDSQVSSVAPAGFKSGSGGGFYQAPDAGDYTFSLSYDSSISAAVLHMLLASNGAHLVTFGG